jgi:hypothetical protein
MKTKSLALAFSIFLVFFAVNSSIMAQNKDSKTTNKVKTTVQKTESKMNDVKQNASTTIHHKNHQIKGGTNTVKNEVKTDLGKDMKKMNDKVKKTPSMTNKVEKKNTDKIKN